MEEKEVREMSAIEQAVWVPAGKARLAAEFAPPHFGQGVVIFAHGSGSSRSSPRNRFVAHELQERGLGTVLMDLLTPDEERSDEWTAALRFDIPLLAGRLEAAVDWLRGELSVPVGLFGASTGAAAALVAAARRPEQVRAVVSRGGRPDLAGDSLPKVKAPTLLIVGSADEEVLALNEAAGSRLRCPWSLEVVPHATHLFEEPGALGQVARHAADWFEERLR